jgi:hypothetical protein
MTPPGQNYPIHEHGFLFWGIYLGIVIFVTFALMMFFIYQVNRTSQAVRAPQPEAAPDATTPLTAATPQPELSHSAA